jgi:uncharacterized LabA/DUF88 family protein
MPEKLLVYVDGFNLYHGLHDAHKHRLLWLDLVMLAKALRPRSHLVAVKYFTATVLNEPAAQSRQDTYIAALKAMHPEQIEVVMGRYSQSTKVCRVCGAKHIHYEEKETDVNIAVNLVADASAKKADSFLIVSADSDVAPAVRMARSLNPRAFIAAAFPPMRFSAELKSLMPSSFHIAPSKFSASQLPQIVHGVGDITHHQPEKWRH